MTVLHSASRALAAIAVVAGASLGVGPALAAVPAANTGPATVSVVVASSNVAVGQGQITASWSAVPGAIGYAVAAKAGGVTVATATVVAPLTSGTIVGLTGGTTYDIVVRAADAANGFGPESSPVRAVALTVPEAPAFSVSGKIVTWTAPNNGGSPITGYTVVQNSSGVTKEAGPADTSVTFDTEDTNAANYTVTATNAVGTSATGAASLPAPGAPTSLSATGTASSITVTWKAPISNGGPAVTGYVASLTKGGSAAGTVTTDAATLRADFTGLSAGTYLIDVRAVNTQGQGIPAGASVTITDSGTVVVGPVAETQTPEQATAIIAAPTSPGGSVGTTTSPPSSAPPVTKRNPTGVLPTTVRAPAGKSTTLIVRKPANITASKLYVWLKSPKGKVSAPEVSIKRVKGTLTVQFRAPKQPGRYELRVYQFGFRTPVATSTLVVRGR